MAKSQSHTFGEFIGSFFEDTMKQPIRTFASQNGLYFDCIGARSARNGKKVTWEDIYGSHHDLDFVLEEGGSDSVIGKPVAFIELAWRRYTKHSKNKVQEIAGAVNPIWAKYRLHNPFKGAILCGQFTSNSLDQLKKDHFHVLYIPFEKLVQAFTTHGFDISFDETTKETEFRRKYMVLTKKSNSDRLNCVRAELLKLCESEIKQFTDNLSIAYNRQIIKINILPLHGCSTEVVDITEAISFINNYQDLPKTSQLKYIELIITYNNGSIIQCKFRDKEEAIVFLNHL